MSIDRRYRLLKSSIDVTDLVSATGAKIDPSLLPASGVTSILGTANQIAASTSAGVVTLSLPQTVIIPTGAANSYALQVKGNATSGQSLGLLVQAGTTSADAAFAVTNQSGGTIFAEIFGDGHGNIGPSSSLGLSWNTTGNVVVTGSAAGNIFEVTDGSVILAHQFAGGGAGPAWIGTLTNHNFDLMANNRTFMQATPGGNVTISAPVSGAPFLVQRTGDGDSIVLQKSGTNFLDIGSGNAFAAGQAEIWTFGTIPLGLGTAGGAADINFYTNSVKRLNISGAGNIAATVASSFDITNGSVVARVEFGGFFQIGSVTDHNILFFTNNGNNFQIGNSAGGGFFATAATGGDKGAGTGNFTGLFVNGVSVGGSSGSFTGTLTGMTGSVTGTFKWTLSNGIVFLYLPTATSGTSNSTVMQLTGLPSAIQPAGTNITAMCARLINNGGQESGWAILTGGSGTVALSDINGIGFTASGTKGMASGWSITYSIL